MFEDNVDVEVVEFANGEPMVVTPVTPVSAVTADAAIDVPVPVASGVGTVATVQEKGALKERIYYAKCLAESRLLPRDYVKNPANVLVAIEYGYALGIPPMEALNSIHIVEGKPTLSAGLMSALVRKAGCKLRVRVEGRGRDAVATASLIRPDDDFEFTCVWDWARAEASKAPFTKSGTVKTNWANYPEAMLKARAISEVCREGAEDFLHGMAYTDEELR